MAKNFDQYLSDVAGLDDLDDNDNVNTNDEQGGGDFRQDTNEQTEQQQQAEEQQQPTPNQQADDNNQQAGNEAQQGQPQQRPQSQNQQEGQQPQQTSQASRPVARHVSGNFLDARGNIVDADGKIVAHAGSQRRQFEYRFNTQREIGQLRQQNQQYEQQLRAQSFLNNVPQQLGLSHEEVASGLEYARRIKAGDILGIARDAVAMAAARGVNISQIVGEKAGDAIELSAIRAMLDERLAPITQSQRQVAQVSQQEQVARDNYQRFVADNEYADVHGDVIVAMMKREGVSLQQAYNSVRSFILSNNFDLSQPLGPQVEARRQEVAQLHQQQQSQQQNNRRPMPNGASSTRAGVVTHPTAIMADPDTDWATIIHDAMNQSGLN